ncbi:MAG: sugar transferase [Planctomycetaceae bacterium]|nr:sugar transferase [Planctomycetaceae bacterium]
MQTQTFYQRYGKRIFDVTVCLLVFAFAWPIMIVLSLLIACYLGRPVCFCQSRPGRNGKLFTMWKFRSMTNARDAQGELLPDAQRMTRFGKLLRSTSLDELPELWNVLRGEMSLIGPRPLLVQYLPLYSERQARRHEVSPGVTGWAQVNGRNGVPWEERFEMDVWYVENCSFRLDLFILWKTFVTVFQRKGVSAEGHVTMPPFAGTEKAACEQTRAA